MRDLLLGPESRWGFGMSSPIVVSGRRLRPTAVYEAYWRFADERQRTFYRKKRGDIVLTKDPIIAAFRFTNAYRVIDRVTQYLISHVIPDGVAQARNLLFRVLLFKVFNKIETWRLLEDSLGPPSVDSFDWSAADGVLSGALEMGQRVYSAAYIMPTPRLGARYKHSNHLLLLRRLVESHLASAWVASRSLRALYELLLGIPSFGKFLSYQYAIDLNYTDAIKFDEDSFVIAGPGAIDGISKCFENAGDIEPEAIIKIVSERQDEEFVRFGLDFPKLYGRRLKLIDCQNLFCEISKYSRISHPYIRGASGRTSIKQTYRPKAASLEEPRFPTSWSLTASKGYEDTVVPIFPR